MDNNYAMETGVSSRRSSLMLLLGCAKFTCTKYNLNRSSGVVVVVGRNEDDEEREVKRRFMKMLFQNQQQQQCHSNCCQRRLRTNWKLAQSLWKCYGFRCELNWLRKLMKLSLRWVYCKSRPEPEIATPLPGDLAILQISSVKSF